MKSKYMMISDNEECLGKYATRSKAKKMAKSETQNTGRKHYESLTHYYCLRDQVNKMCWTVSLVKKI